MTTSTTWAQELFGGWRSCNPMHAWVTSLGVGAVLRGFGAEAERITELDWTETVSIAGESREICTITSLPARHFSGRSAFNRFETLWASFVLRGSDHSVYAGADSGWWEGFAEIGAAYGPFDLTMLEIGAYNELWKQIHLGPDAAAQAFQEMGGGGAANADPLGAVQSGTARLASADRTADRAGGHGRAEAVGAAAGDAD